MMTRGRRAVSADGGRLDSGAVLEALEDDGCRAILAATSGGAMTAKELVAACELPRSTLYRKLDLLTDAALLEERTRIPHVGKHVREYRRQVDQVVVSLETDVAVELVTEPPTEEPLPGD